MFERLDGKKSAAKIHERNSKKEYSNTALEDNLWGPTQNADQAWSQLQKRCEKFAQNGDWGQYATAKKHMASQLYSEGRMTDALGHASAALFLTLNGPYAGGMGDFRKLVALNKSLDEPEVDFWNPDEDDYVDPNILTPFMASALAAGLDIDEMKVAFTKGCEKFAPKKTRAPLSYEAAWDLLIAESAFIQSIKRHAQKK
jgi:hypothetical protein